MKKPILGIKIRLLEMKNTLLEMKYEELLTSSQLHIDPLGSNLQDSQTSCGVRAGLTNQPGSGQITKHKNCSNRLDSQGKTGWWVCYRSLSNDKVHRVKVKSVSVQLRAREELPRALDTLLHERVGRSAELAESLVALPDLGGGQLLGQAKWRGQHAPIRLLPSDVAVSLLIQILVITVF